MNQAKTILWGLSPLWKTSSFQTGPVWAQSLINHLLFRLGKRAKCDRVTHSMFFFLLCSHHVKVSHDSARGFFLLFVTWESAVDQGRGPIGHHLAGLAPPPGSFFPGWASPLSIVFLLLFFSLRLQHIYMNVSQVVSLSLSLAPFLFLSLSVAFSVMSRGREGREEVTSWKLRRHRSGRGFIWGLEKNVCLAPPSSALLSAGTRESELDEILMKSSACVICCGASKASAAAADHCCCCCCCCCSSSCSAHIFPEAPLRETSICSQHGCCRWMWAGLEAFSADFLSSSRFFSSMIPRRKTVPGKRG